MDCHRFIFPEDSGAQTYDSIGSASGTLTNATRPSPGRYGLGHAVQLQPSASSHVDFSQPVGQFGTSDFTVALWLKTAEQQRYFDIVGNRTAPSHGNFFSMRMTGNYPGQPSGRISVEVDQDESGTNFVAVESKIANLNDNRWHHVMAVRAGPSLTLYVDGVFAGASAGKSTAAIKNGNPFRLGASLAGFISPNALYCDLGVFDQQLDAQEALHLYCFH
jgi:Concanavalin A-like lectin/glucanases superfamily